MSAGSVLILYTILKNLPTIIELIKSLAEIEQEREVQATVDQRLTELHRCFKEKDHEGLRKLLNGDAAGGMPDAAKEKPQASA